jgi:hypothetical protein
MASGTLVSRVLGLLSRSILVALLGTAAANAGANAFDVANKLPNLIYALVAGGALNAVLVPQIVRADRDGERGREFLDRLFTMTTVALLVLSIVLTLAARPLVLLYTDDWRAQDLDLAVAFALWCIPQLFFYGVYTLFGQLLNARGSFGPYTWAPVANNVVAVAGLVAFFVAFGPQPFTEARDWTPAMVALLAGSATLGVAAQALILVVPLRRIGFRWVPRWGLRGVGFRTAGTGGRLDVRRRRGRPAGVPAGLERLDRRQGAHRGHRAGRGHRVRTGLDQRVPALHAPPQPARRLPRHRGVHAGVRVGVTRRHRRRRAADRAHHARPARRGDPAGSRAGAVRLTDRRAAVRSDRGAGRRGR